MVKKTSYIFKSNEELLKFITNEIKKYIGKFNTDVIIPGYNRMTLEEITNEVFIKLLRTGSELEDMNKTFVRNAVVMTCIDLYRKPVDHDPVDLTCDNIGFELDESYSPETQENIPAPDLLIETERLIDLKTFDQREQVILLKLMQGLKNSEIFESLGMSKNLYYSLLRNMREQLI